MKPVLLFSVMVMAMAITRGVYAVELNKEAMKTMQEEGHRIVEESKGGRVYKSVKNFCLDIAGDGLVVRKCSADAEKQRWIMDDASRLVAHDGRCVAGARLAKCGTGKGQKWKHDGNKRLRNQNKQCLQFQGEKPKAGAKVAAVACNKSDKQVWN